jgi:hypothetical protein
VLNGDGFDHWSDRLFPQPAMAGQRILLIRGLMDYIPGISPMTLLKARQPSINALAMRSRGARVCRSI